MELDFTEFKAPFVFRRTEETRYSQLTAQQKNGGIELCFKAEADGNEGTFLSRTKNLIRWTAPESAAWTGRPDAIQIGNATISLKGKELSLEEGGRRTVLSKSTQSFTAACGHAIAEEDGRLVSYSLEDASCVVLDMDQSHLAGEGATLSSPSAVVFGSFTYLFYIIDGSIAVAATADGVNFISFMRDKPTYPENGTIYEGDYYRPLPFHEYIHHEDIPRGEGVFDVRSFGAVPSTMFLSTPAFRAAFAAAAKCRGTVVVDGGYYCVSTLIIPSGVTLFIAEGSAIVASRDLSRFCNMMIGCIDAEDVTIRGGGRIIGNGEYFVHLPLWRPRLKPLDYIKLPPVPYDSMGYPVDSIRYAYRARIRYAFDPYGTGGEEVPRPLNNVWIRGSRNVLIENIVIEDSFEWTLNLEFSRNVTVRDVVINDNRHVANTDGIDITSSIDVDIDHCFISCADDGICIKAPRYQEHDDRQAEGVSGDLGPTENVRIRNCTVLTVMNSFKIGTGTFYDVKNIDVEDCTFMLPDIYPGSTSGIAIECADGCTVSDVTVRNIRMDSVCCPIFIMLNRRNCDGFLDAEDEKRRRNGGHIQNVLIENVEAKKAEMPSIITGFHDKTDGVTGYIDGVTIRNYACRYAEDREVLDIRDEIHESITDYPESNSFGDVPAYGIYVRHAKNIALEDVSIEARSMNTRECIVCEDAEVR